MRGAAMTFIRWLAGAGVFVLVGCANDATHVAVTGVESPEAFLTCAVDIENFAGEVSVVVDPRLSVPVVRCYALGPGAEADTTVVKQTAAKVTATATEVSGRTVLHVVSMSEGEGHASAVTLSVRTPNCEGLRVRNKDGVVRVTGAGGAMDIENTGAGADVIVATDRAVAAPVSVNAPNGRIDYSMSGDSAGRLDLAANGGRVEVWAARGRLEGVRSDGRMWTGVLNRGENEMKFRTGGKEIVVRLRREGAAEPKQAVTRNEAPKEPAGTEAHE